MRSFQTPHHRLGGVLTAVAPTVSTHEFIRSFEKNVIWSIPTVKGSRIHLINVHALDSSNTKEEKDKVLNGQSSLSAAKNSQSQRSRVSANSRGLQQGLQAYENMLSKLGITSLLPSGTVTHLQGGALDQVFTNMITDSYSLSDSFLSDHKAIVANFKIN